MTPKLQKIMESFEQRLLDIDGADPYHTEIGKNVYRGRTQFNMAEIPYSTVFLGPLDQGALQRERIIVEASIVIHARVGYTDQVAEDLAIYMLADIQTAIERGDRTIDGLLSDDFQWLRDEILYPDPNQAIVAVETTYAIPHMRLWGNPN